MRIYYGKSESGKMASDCYWDVRKCNVHCLENNGSIKVLSVLCARILFFLPTFHSCTHERTWRVVCHFKSLSYSIEFDCEYYSQPRFIICPKNFGGEPFPVVEV